MSPVLALLGEVTAVFMLALGGAALAAKGRAALRHLILASAFGIALVLPLAMLVTPTITVELALLPAPARETAEPVTLLPAMPAAPAMDMAPLAVEVIAASETQPPAPAFFLPLTTWLLAGWAVIALIVLLPVVSGLWHLRRIRHRGKPWDQAARWLDRLEVRLRPVVLLDDGIAAPVTGGLLRPVIVLPADAARWSEAHITNALLHELEHARRHDWAVQIATRVTCALYWFHPLAWIAWRALRLEAERACDDAVLSRGDAARYAQQLLQLARRMADRPVLPGLQMAGSSSLAARIKAVLDDARPRGRTGRRVVVGVVVAAGVVIAMLAPLRMTGSASQASDAAVATAPSAAAAEEGSTAPLTAEEAPAASPASPMASPPQEQAQAQPEPMTVRDAGPASPRAIVASILDLVQGAMADESTASLDELTRPITGLHHVQRHALVVLEGNPDPAVDAAHYTEIINALINTANLAANVASRPPRADLSLPAFQQLATALRGKSAELAGALLPIAESGPSGMSTPQQLAARSVIDLMQATRRDTPFFNPLRGFWLTTELGTLERAAQSLASDDGAVPGAAALKLGAFRNSIQSTARQANQIAGRPNLAPDARSKAAGLAASLRKIEDRLTAPAVAAARVPEDASWKVSLRSIGPLPIGASLSDVRSIIGDPSAHLVQALRRNGPLAGGPDPGCAYLVSPAVPAQVGLLFRGGRLVRADVWKPGIRTTGDVQVGDSESRLLETYGPRISVAHDPRVAASPRYRVFTPAEEVDQEYGMRFEMADNVISQYRAGLRTAVEQADGCD